MKIGICSLRTTLGVLALALCSVYATAQEPTPAPTTGITLTTTAGAMGVCLHLNSCNVGSISTEGFTVTPNFSIEATQLLSPSDNLSLYGAGVKYTPSLDAFLTKHTLIPAHTLQLAFHASPGLLNNASTGAVGSPHVGALSGLEIGYSPMSDGKFVVAFGGYGLYAPGFGAAGNFGVGYSGSIGYLFGGTKPAGTAAVHAQARRVWGTK